MVTFPASVPANNPAIAGELATEKQTFGDCSRYAVAAVHTRFDAVSWFVWDANRVDEITGEPLVIRQNENPEKAVAGLTDETPYRSAQIFKAVFGKVPTYKNGRALVRISYAKFSEFSETWSAAGLPNNAAFGFFLINDVLSVWE